VGRTVICQITLLALLSWSFVACKSDDDGEGGSGGSGASTGGTGGGDDGSAGSSGSAGAAGTPATHPPPSCFSGIAQCNPINNAPCEFDEACDIFVEDGGVELVCFPPHNVRPVGGICYDDGPYCRAELHCKGERCLEFCCSNADCPDNGTCTPLHPEKGTLGTCPLPPDAGT
jgi:hypothetical protein